MERSGSSAVAFVATSGIRRMVYNGRQPLSRHPGPPGGGTRRSLTTGRSGLWAAPPAAPLAAMTCGIPRTARTGRRPHFRRHGAAAMGIARLSSPRRSGSSEAMGTFAWLTTRMTPGILVMAKAGHRRLTPGLGPVEEATLRLPTTISSGFSAGVTFTAGPPGTTFGAPRMGRNGPRPRCRRPGRPDRVTLPSFLEGRCGSSVVAALRMTFGLRWMA
jgi:hypothetical protein